MAAKLSVIVCTRNRASELLAVLAALRAQTRVPDEVVIVDAGDRSLLESDRAADIRGCGLNVTHMHVAPALARQRNLGARASTGDLLVYLDDDVVPDPDFLATMEETFERHPEYEAGMGTLKTPLPRWTRGGIVGRLFLLQREHGDGRFSASGMARHPYGTTEFRDVEVFGTGLMAVRRRVFVDEGIEFDERLTGYSSQEDADFSRRLSRRHRLFFNPRAVVDHRPSPHGRASVFEQSRAYMQNFRYLYGKNFRPAAPWTLPLHWWAVVGLFIVAIGGRSWDRVRGYAAGLRERVC